LTVRPPLLLGAATSATFVLVGASDPEAAPLALMRAVTLGIVAGRSRAVAWALAVPPAFLGAVYARFDTPWEPGEEGMLWFLALVACLWIAVAIALAVAVRTLFERLAATRPRQPSPAATRAGTAR
jgi:hypothetical protein